MSAGAGIATLAELTRCLEQAPVIARRLDGTIRLWTEGAASMYGFTAPEALGRRSHDLLRTRFPAPVESIDEELLRTGRWQGELVHLRRDGSEMTVASTWSLLSDAGLPGGPVVIEVNSDITRRLEAESALRESEATLRGFYDSAPTLMGIVELTDDGDILHILDNSSSCRFFGVPPEEIRGRCASELGVSAGNIRLWRGHYEEAARRDEPVRFEWPYGEGAAQRWLWATVARIDIPGRRRFCYTAEDITGRKQAEKALFDSAADLHSIFEQAAVGMAQVAPDGKWLRANRQLSEITGYPIEELLGLTFQDITHPDDLEKDLGLLRALLAGETTSYQMEKRYLRRDGTTRWVEIFVALVRDAAGAPRHFITVVEDIERRKAAETEVRRLTATLEHRVAERTRQLADANQELEAFAYSVSHDLRAPLRSMQGFGQALLEEKAGRLDEEGRDWLDRIVRGAARLDELIRDLLAYSRIARTDVRLTQVPIDDLVAGLLQELPAEARPPGTRIAVDAPLGTVIGHAAILRQVLLNLLTNALKFVAPGAAPAVTIGAERRGDRLRILVSDEGIGIAAEHQQRVFDVFNRLHGSADYPGTGIGLAIVRRGVERLGGSVGVESSPSAGATFWIELAAGDPG